ncbi:hypothetical protein [Streptomyces phaeofaciens]
MTYVLALAATAVSAGATSLLAISEWVADAPPEVLGSLDARRGPLSFFDVATDRVTVREAQRARPPGC